MRDTQSSTLQDVLDELEAVEQIGPDEWKARCPAHNDNNPSLSVTVGDDYPVLLHCHAGCDFQEVAEELDSLSTHWKPWEGTEVDRYTYESATGDPLFDVVRYEMRDEEHPACGEKKFTQQAYLPDHEDAGENGCPDGYVWGRKKHDVGVVLYRLPSVLEAADEGRRVFVVEGEKDVQTLERWDLTATTNPQGAENWHPRFTEALDGAQVVILPDNDEEGRKHARKVAQEVIPVAEGVRIVELPNLPEKGDVTDWAEAGHMPDELRQIVHETPPFEPQENGQASPSADFGDRYEAQNGRIMHFSEDDDSGRIVADFQAEITREVTNEDGSRTYRVEGRTREGRPFELDIPASEFERDQKLKSAIGAAAGAKAPVRAGMTRHISPALKMLSSDVETRRRYRRTGWSEDGFLLPGRTPEDVEVVLPESLPYQASKAGSIEEGKEALDNLIRSLGPEKTTPLVAFAVTGQLGRHVDLLKRHAFFVKGRTGSLKTSWSQVVMCLFGPAFIRDENLLKMGEGMTRNAAMALAGSAHDLPILFDNYKPTTGKGDQGFINLIHNVIEGGEKARLNRNSELKDRKDIRAWPIVTGEDLPDTDPASLARLLTVEFSWTNGEDNPELTAAQERPEDLSRVGTAWIEWLQSEDGREVLSELEESFPERRKKWAAYLRKRRPDMVNILRVASNLATNTLAFNAAARCPVLREVLESHREAYQEGMLSIAYNMGDYTCESLEARRFIEGLKSLKAAGRARFAQRLGDDYTIDDQVGYKDAEGYYLILDLAMEAVEELYKRSGGLGGVTRQTLCSQLKDIGLVARTGRNKTTRTVRTGTGRKRVLHLKKDALEDTEEETEEQDE
jgi:hypothetical protein